MPRRAKGARLYLRTSVRDGRTGKRLPDVWVIRDGSRERSTGCGPGEQPAAERALGDYIAEKFQAPDLKADSRRDPALVLVAEVVALYSQDKAASSGLDSATFDRFVANLLTRRWPTSSGPPARPTPPTAKRSLTPGTRIRRRRRACPARRRVGN